MSKATATLPTARTWRDIPQRVKPRAMSREGRRRLVARAWRVAGGLALLGAGGWAALEVSATLRGDATAFRAGDQAAPIGDRINLTTDGVLDRAWLVRTLALPKNATLLSLDLRQLRARLLACGQVSSASIALKFPSTLAVALSERNPVVRVLAQVGTGEPKPLLVSRDGTVYEGAGYDPAMVASLPWLDGVSLVRRGTAFAPVEGMGTAADLLQQAQSDDEPLYQTWQVLSLSRLQSDGEIEVRARGGLSVIFGTREKFFSQLARLDLVLDAHPDRPIRQIDLSLGPQVPVSLQTALPNPSHSPPREF